MAGANYLCLKLVDSSSSGGFRVSFEWLNLHAACSMRITSSLDTYCEVCLNGQLLIMFKEKLRFACFKTTMSILNLKPDNTAVQLVFNPFSQLVPQVELYSQLQLSLPLLF